MAASLIYRNRLVYESAMLVLYGRHYFSRYRSVAELIPQGASVLDLCCGPAVLYERYLREKSVDYLGLDINENFIRRLKRKGVHAILWNLREDEPLPPADYVIMQASLYHFLPDPTSLLKRMLQAARKQVIIAEPIRNLTSFKLPLLTSFSAQLTDAGAGAESHRFTEQTLDGFLTRFYTKSPTAFLIRGGREKIYILQSQPE